MGVDFPSRGSTGAIAGVRDGASVGFGETTELGGFVGTVGTALGVGDGTS